MLGKYVRVRVTNPIRSVNRQFGFVYQLNFGAIEGKKRYDSVSSGAYIMGINHPVRTFDGRVIAAIKRIKPPIYAKTVLLNIESFCVKATAKKPANVERDVAINIGINTALGFDEPSSALYISILIGTMVTAEAFITINIIWAFEAVSFCLFNSCICSMAFNPMGVAALSKPSILAAIFITIEPIAG